MEIILHMQIKPNTVWLIPRGRTKARAKLGSVATVRDCGIPCRWVLNHYFIQKLSLNTGKVTAGNPILI